jgi:hypothetical protein
MSDAVFQEKVLSASTTVDRALLCFPDPLTFRLEGIGKGAVFIFAPLSGPCLRAWKAFTVATADLGKSGFRIYVFDNYSLPTSFVSGLLPETPTGYGDTYWIKSGSITKIMRRYGDPEIQQIKSIAQQL